jgi:hypothetical protein
MYSNIIKVVTYETISSRKTTLEQQPRNTIDIGIAGCMVVLD